MFCLYLFTAVSFFHCGEIVGGSTSQNLCKRECEQNGGTWSAQEKLNYYDINIHCATSKKCSTKKACNWKCYKPTPSPCQDSNPRKWIELLEDPCNFKYENKMERLSGPACDGSPKQKIGVVGAGMAGLTLSYILQHIGHQVVLLEASDRIGGKVDTYYGKGGWYGDLGAMRFPNNKSQPLTHSIINKFLGSDALTSFTTYHQGPASYFYVNGKYFSANEYLNNNQSVLKQIYGLFDVDLSNDVLKNKTKGSGSTLLNPTTILDDLVEQNNALDACLYPQSLESYLRSRLANMAGPQGLVNIWSVLSLERAYLPLSLWEYVSSSPGAISPEYTEIRNGSSELPNAIFKNLTSNTNFSYKLNSRVTKSIKESDNQVKLEISGMKDETFNKVIFATTSRAASLIKFDPPLPYNKTFALNSYHYTNTVKIFLHFTEPFWNKTKADGNKITRIPYGCSPGHHIPNELKCGGTGNTDLSMRSIYYPSNYLHGTSLLVSYVWSDDADRLTSLPDTELVQRALDDLGQIHGFHLVNQSFNWKNPDEHYYVKKWAEDEYAGGGAFPWGYPFQDLYLLDALGMNTPPIYFAGEYTEKRFHSWIQAAVASGCRVAWEMFGGKL